MSTQLQHSQYQEWQVAADWRPLVHQFFTSKVGLDLLAFLHHELESGVVIFPPTPLKALDLTPKSQVRVVILGQDPYHGRGQAQGLAFSVPPGVPIPPSLRNIFKELQRDLGVAIPTFPSPGGSLDKWAQHGVLLLNTCLTVAEGKPASHAKKGWEVLTDAIIKDLNQGDKAIVFMLWGAQAQSKAGLIDANRHLVLCANHPSPLSAHRLPTPFIGCGHFSKVKIWQDFYGINQ